MITVLSGKDSVRNIVPYVMPVFVTFVAKYNKYKVIQKIYNQSWKMNIAYKELQTYPSFLAIVTLKLISHLYMLGKASPIHKQQWGLDTCLIRGAAMGAIIQYHHNQRDICQYTTPILTQHASINCYRHFLRCNAIMIVSIQCKRVEFLARKAVTKACSRLLNQVKR